MRVPDFRKIIDFPKHFQERFGKLAAKLHKQHIKTMKRPSGFPFKKLSPRYAKTKKEMGKPAIPDLELSGAMLNEFKFHFAMQEPNGEFRVQYGIQRNKKYPGKNVGTADVMNIHAEGIGTMPARPVSQLKYPIYKGMEEDLVEAMVGQIATNIHKVMKVPVLVIRA